MMNAHLDATAAKEYIFTQQSDAAHWPCVEDSQVLTAFQFSSLREEAKGGRFSSH